MRHTVLVAFQRLYDWQENTVVVVFVLVPTAQNNSSFVFISSNEFLLLLLLLIFFSYNLFLSYLFNNMSSGIILLSHI